MASTFSEGGSDTTHASHPTLDLNVNATSSFTGTANNRIDPTFGFTTDFDYLEINIGTGVGAIAPGSSLRISFAPADAYFYRVTGRIDSFSNLHSTQAYPGSTSTFIRHEPGINNGDETTFTIPTTGLPSNPVLEIEIVAGGPPNSTFPTYSPLSSYTVNFVNFGVIGGGGGSSPPTGGGDGGTANDFPANTSTPGTAAVGGSVSGAIGTAGDQDWYLVQLIAGVTYIIQLSGGTLSDTYLRLYSSNGQLITENDDFNGLNSQITFTPTTSALLLHRRGRLQHQHGHLHH